MPTTSPTIDPGAWSAPVDGVRGRLVARTVPGAAASRRQVAIDLELENVSTSAAPIVITWGALGPMFDFTLADQENKPIARSMVGGNEMSPLPHPVSLLTGSTMKVPISKAAFEYVPSGVVMLRPLTFWAWDMPSPRPTSLILAGKFHAAADPDAHDPKRWKGELVLPPIALAPPS